MKLARKSLVFVSLVALLALSTAPAGAEHSWSTYHWARTTTEFTLKLGNNVTFEWDADSLDGGYLGEASTDWSTSTVLDTTTVAGTVKNVKQCTPPSGRVEVCNSKYGFNGWLGVAGIYLTGGHIYKGYVKLNDSYFNTATYNTPAWRRLVMCQEIGHTFGLDHQDEIFDNENRGTCMDYTNDPDGGPGGFSETDPSNEHPNTHDYDQLVDIYSPNDHGGHLDTTTTVGQSVQRGKSSRSRVVDVDSHGNGTVTWIFWTD